MPRLSRFCIVDAYRAVAGMGRRASPEAQEKQQAATRHGLHPVDMCCALIAPSHFLPFRSAE